MKSIHYYWLFHLRFHYSRQGSFKCLFSWKFGFVWKFILTVWTLLKVYWVVCYWGRIQYSMSIYRIQRGHFHYALGQYGWTYFLLCCNLRGLDLGSKMQPYWLDFSDKAGSFAFSHIVRGRMNMPFGVVHVTIEGVLSSLLLRAYSVFYVYLPYTKRSFSLRPRTIWLNLFSSLL